MQVLGVVASPSSASRTRTLVEAVLAAASMESGVSTRLVTLAGDADPVSAIDAADAVVFGMPIYRASYPGSLKNLLDLVPRGGYDGVAPALRAKPVVIAATGATDHHFLALDDLGSMLRGFFAAYVLPPGLYASHDDFVEGKCSERLSGKAAQAGRALVDLQKAIAASPALTAVEPMV